MADLSLDLRAEAVGTEAYGDLLLDGSGAMTLTSSTEAVRQSLELRLRAGIGDYFYAVDEGLPWGERFASLDFYNPALDAALKNTVLGTPGVRGIVDWTVAISRSKRIVTITMEIEAQSGIIQFSLPLGA